MLHIYICLKNTLLKSKLDIFKIQIFKLNT